MIILGVDPGSLFTGYGIIQRESKNFELVACGRIKMKATMSHPNRLQVIYKDLSALIDEHHPDECAIEMPVYGGNPQSILKLGRAQAAAILAAIHREIPVVEYTPKEVKKAVTGNGNASKKQVMFMVSQMLSIHEEIEEDASDALAVSLCHAHRSKTESANRFKNWGDFVKANPERIKSS